MGYSARYHVASLAAVFVALAIGILIGAALGSDVVSGTAESLEEDLAHDLEDLRAENLALGEDLEAERAFAGQLAPAVVRGSLAGQEIALIGLGDVDANVLTADLQDALEPTQGRLTEVATVREPPDATALVDALLTRGEARREEEPLALAAERAGRLLAGRGESLGTIRTTLLSGSSGNPEGLDGAIVTRARPDDLSPREESQTETLEAGLIRGLRDAGLRVIGAERSDTDPSSISFFTDQNLASVDNVNELPGKVALALALDGADGRFGTKETADSLLPELIDPAAGG